MEIIVPDDQLSLAIGRRGQNVRLAAQLTGWKLDINSESRVKELREFANQSLGSLPEMSDPMVELLYSHGFRQAKDILDANPEVLIQLEGVTAEMVAQWQEASKDQSVIDARELARLNVEREAERLAQARRHPDELSQQERLLRVRGCGEKAIEQLAQGSYHTVEDVVNEQDLMRLADSSGLGIKKARQLKHAASLYLEEEAKLRKELNAERDAQAVLNAKPSSLAEEPAVEGTAERG
jgi:N utilization substance protein A